MKRKFLYILITLITLFGLTSCTQENSDIENTYSDAPEETTREETLKPTSTAAADVNSVLATDTAVPVFSCEDISHSEVPIESFASPNSKTLFFPYLDDPCEYLEKQFDEGKSAPGTVVMPIMFHSISDNCVRDSDGSCITDVEFYELMDALIANGFEAISAEEFTGFLYNNEVIPHRSVLLIADDRRNGIYFETFFQSYYEDYGWPVISAYIASNSLGMRVTEENAALEKEGWVDHQAHGAYHNIPITNWRWDAEINGMNAYK